MSSACSGVVVERDARWTVRVGDADREADVHLPPAYDGRRALPLVLSLHALGSSAALQATYTGLGETADEAGFVLVHPEGIGASWNAGIGCCGAALAAASDDIGFIAALLDRLESELCVDRARAYVVGMSNGGYMTHRVACELSSRLAAVASVAGIDATAECEPESPISLLQIHGTSDTVVPYASAVRSVASWRDRNGCAESPTLLSDEGGARCESWSCERDTEVVGCSLLGSIHVWPGGLASPAALDANEVIWDFFQRHSRAR